MTSQIKLENILAEMATLLRSYGNETWAEAFSRLSKEVHIDPAGVLSEIRRMYGGMGSLSDIVLYTPNGSLLPLENNRFDALRHELYQLSRAI